MPGLGDGGACCVAAAAQLGVLGSLEFRTAMSLNRFFFIYCHWFSSLKFALSVSLL